MTMYSYVIIVIHTHKTSITVRSPSKSISRLQPAFNAQLKVQLQLFILLPWPWYLKYNLFLPCVHTSTYLGTYMCTSVRYLPFQKEQFSSVLFDRARDMAAPAPTTSVPSFKLVKVRFFPINFWCFLSRLLIAFADF